ncbi:MAG: NUDIX hydrolase [Pyrinomonadaceae bacterium]|nr:NUDIX hydrolase [Pyrinomonadaceae bacterium]
MEKPDKWKRVESEELADCRVFKVRKDVSQNLASGNSATFFVTENPDWINVIPITENREVVLIQQYRHGTQENTLEIPGGMIDRNETSSEAAKRELLEETGFSASSFLEIGRSRPNPAIQDNWVYHFLASGCRLTGKTDFDEHESIITRLVPFERIPSLIEYGEITHSLVLAAFYNLAIRKKGV